MRTMRLAIDSHVHVYPFFSAPRLLEVAHRNLSRCAPTADRYVLCLTERAGMFAFEALARGDLRATPWTIEATPDAQVLRAHTADGRSLHILAGRQIIAAERVEVLALGVDLRLDDGLPLREIIARVRDAGALPVLPWGLGRWWGQRGRLLAARLAEAKPGDLALGDTYLLPALAPRPALLRRAASACWPGPTRWAGRAKRKSSAATAWGRWRNLMTRIPPPRCCASWATRPYP